MKAGSMDRAKRTSGYLILSVIFVLFVNLSLGLLLMRKASDSMISLLQTRMLDISNTAAAMLDGDTLRDVTPEDKGTPQYDNVMKTLTYFQDNIELNYIYCIRDMGDGTFTFGLDPTVEDPGKFGSPIVYTDALYKASKGEASADNTKYEDAWGSFYSAYSPVFDSRGEVAGIVAVDFSAEWYEAQIATLSRITSIVALISLIGGASIAFALITFIRRRLGEVHGQLNDLADNLMHEIGKDAADEQVDNAKAAGLRQRGDSDIDALGKRIQSMQSELRSQFAQVHEQAYMDGLTGTKNRAAYLESVMEIEMAAKDGVAAFSVAVFDLNGLKTINDNYGHESGDMAIKDASEVIKKVFGKRNVYRTGGDEFVAIIDTSDDNVILDLFARVERDLDLANMVSRPYKMPLSISKGYSIYRQGDTFKDTFNRADMMMYSDKEAFYSGNRDRRR